MHINNLINLHVIPALSGDLIIKTVINTLHMRSPLKAGMTIKGYLYNLHNSLIYNNI